MHLFSRSLVCTDAISWPYYCTHSAKESHIISLNKGKHLHTDIATTGLAYTRIPITRQTIVFHANKTFDCYCVTAPTSQSKATSTPLTEKTGWHINCLQLCFCKDQDCAKLIGLSKV